MTFPKRKFLGPPKTNLTRNETSGRALPSARCAWARQLPPPSLGGGHPLGIGSALFHCGGGAGPRASWRRVCLAVGLTCPHPTGSRLHCPRGGRGGQEVGAHQGRETRAQLHDGHAAHQAGEPSLQARLGAALLAVGHRSSCQSCSRPSRVATGAGVRGHTVGCPVQGESLRNVTVAPGGGEEHSCDLSSLQKHVSRVWTEVVFGVQVPRAKAP